MITTPIARRCAQIASLVLIATLFAGTPGPVSANGYAAQPETWVGRAAESNDDVNGAIAGTSCSLPDYIAGPANADVQIQLGVNHTLAGGTLHLCAGTYTIDTTIDLSGKAIALSGASAATTILDGGTIYADDLVDVEGVRILYSDNAITVADLTLRNALAVGNGGAISTSNSATVSDSIFANNSATTAGAIYANTTATVARSTFTSNTARDFAGAIYAETVATVTDSSFTDNTADLGGAITATTATVARSTFTRNTATSIGGAIFTYTVANVTRSTFTRNTAGYVGGAIYTQHVANVTRSTFTRNTATTGGGGAIYAETVANVTRSTFTRNTTTVDGGGIRASTGTISNSRFTSNTAGEHGGAVLFAVATAGDLQELRGNTLTRNRAPAGGAITLTSCGPVYSRKQVRRLESANDFAENRATEQRSTSNIQRLEDVCA
jgi:predicted outer membrane repeat protein